MSELQDKFTGVEGSMSEELLAERRAQTAEEVRVHRHLRGRVEDLERLTLAHANRALAAENLADLLAGEIRHVLEEGCDDGCLAKALAAYDEWRRPAQIDGSIAE